MTRNIELEAVIARLRQWLAEGKDIRLVASRRAIDGFPMIEMWDDRAVEVLTAEGIIHEDARGNTAKPQVRQASVSSIATYAAAKRPVDRVADSGQATPASRVGGARR